MLIGSLCDSGSTHSVGFQEYIYQWNFIVVKFHFLFRNKLILILILILNQIDEVQEFNFLGITIDQNITWTPHIRKITYITSHI